MARQNVRYAELTVTPYQLDAPRHRRARRSWRRSRTPARPPRPSSASCCAGASTSPARRGWRRPRRRCGSRCDLRARGAGLASGSAAPRSACRGRSSSRTSTGRIAAGLHSVPHAGETTGPETIWDALHDLRRRAHRPRHQRRPGPGAARPPGRAPHPAGGLPDLQHRHPRGRAPSTSTRSGRWSRPGVLVTDQLRRPADVRHRPQHRVRGRRPAARTSTSAGVAALAKNAVEASFLDAGRARRGSPPRSTRTPPPGSPP